MAQRAPEEQMRLVILAQVPMPEGIRVDRDAPNPGIGGTQFTRLRLADAFAKRFPHHRVEVVSDHDVTLVPDQPNLTVTAPVGFEDRLRALATETDDWILTGPSMLLRRLDPVVLQTVAKRTIITSHLMHDVDLWEAERNVRFGAVGCTGPYHFQASRSRSPRVYLRDLFLPGWSTHLRGRSAIEDGAFRIVHVGALLPLKGFHDFARLWPEIRVVLPQARLDVIGGSSTYGRPSDHPVLPTNRSFGNEILRNIPEQDLFEGRVVFHGNLGPDKVKIMRQADVAVLNVSGRPECFPATALECLDLGIPVIGSARFGLWDTMHRLPECTTRDSAEVVKRLAEFAKSPTLRAEMSRRATVVADGFRAENDVILNRWETVAAALLAGNTPPAFAPEKASRSWAAHTAEHLRKRVRYELGQTRTAHSVRAIRRRFRAYASMPIEQPEAST
jgi:glycosyltransferase involved in cell wall biosynthesis